MHQLAANSSAAPSAHADDAVNAVRFLADPSAKEAHPQTKQKPTSPPPSAVRASAGQPVGLYVVCAAEFWERIGSCLLLSLLVLYFTERLGTAPTVAVQRVGSFNAAGYIVSLAGGWVINRWFAARYGAVAGALLLAGGFGVLAADAPGALPLAVALLVAGSGLFRPSITLALSQLYARIGPRRDAGHIWFWIVANLGSALAPLLAGVLRGAAGWRAAFITGAASLLLCVAVLVIGRRALASAIPAEASETARSESDAHVDQVGQFWGFIAVAVATLLYTVGYGQLDGMLLLWARDRTDRHLLGREIPTSWFASLPAIWVLLLGPVLLGMMRELRRRSREPSELGKLALGLLAGGFAFVLMAIGGSDSGTPGSPLWLLGCFALLVIGELLIMPLGLSLMTKLVKPQHAGLVSGAWYGITATGFLIAGEAGVLLQEESPRCTFAILASIYALGAAFLTAVSRGAFRQKADAR